MDKAKIEINDVSMGVYKKIANWHNSEEPASVQNIAELSNDIVEYVLSEAFNQDIESNNVGIEMGPDAQKNMMDMFKKKQLEDKPNRTSSLFDKFFGNKK